MYSKPTCPYCKMAKEALKKFVGTDNLPADQYEVVEISGDPDMNEIQDYLNTITGGRSVCTKDFLFNLTHQRKFVYVVSPNHNANVLVTKRWFYVRSKILSLNRL